MFLESQMFVPIVPNPSVFRDLNLPTFICQLLFIVCTTLAFAAPAEAKKLKVDELEQGRRLYQEGILSSGAKLKGVRFDKTVVEGEAAACTKCHRKSGMGLSLIHI